ncbi:MFS transporter [Amnibacterium sp.]|uniref:MFS transporter n=1 Tax=Amnibacterium sp. TaxID=1872496 RepID=UPI002635CBF1|nr:MFS transporter [Amnibacterium sp.]MCU1472082.1 transporter [Amnibacterium sp.]
MRSALRSPSFRRLAAALAASQCGDWLYNVALLVFVFDRTHSVLWVSVTTVMRVLPIVVLGPLGGALADRFDRRRLMILSDVLRAALMLLLTVVVVSGAPVVLAPVLAGLATAASIAYPPATAASTPKLVPAADLPGANAVRSVIGAGSVLAGPAIGALLLTLTDPAALFAINAATFVLSALLIAAIPAGPAFAPAGGAGEDPLLRQLAEGLRELRRHPVAARFVGADILCSVLYGAETVLLVLVSQQDGWGDHGYGLLLAATGAGGVIGTALVSRLGRFSRVSRIVAVALLAAGAPLALMASVPALALALVLCAVNGAGAVIVEVFTETALQQQLDDAVFGRAYGFAFPASIGGIALGSLIAAPLAGLLGLAGALLVLAAGVCIYAVVLITARPASRIAVVPAT